MIDFNGGNTEDCVDEESKAGDNQAVSRMVEHIFGRYIPYN